MKACLENCCDREDVSRGRGGKERSEERGENGWNWPAIGSAGLAFIIVGESTSGAVITSLPSPLPFLANNELQPFRCRARPDRAKAGGGWEGGCLDPGGGSNCQRNHTRCTNLSRILYTHTHTLSFLFRTPLHARTELTPRGAQARTRFIPTTERSGFLRMIR